jgi:hypothetical protein
MTTTGYVAIEIYNNGWKKDKAIYYCIMSVCISKFILAKKKIPLQLLAEYKQVPQEFRNYIRKEGNMQMFENSAENDYMIQLACDSYEHSYIRTEEQGGDCAICLNNDAACWSELNCTHKFHTNCLKQLVNHVCPLCREPITEVNENVYTVL